MHYRLIYITAFAITLCSKGGDVIMYKRSQFQKDLYKTAEVAKVWHQSYDCRQVLSKLKAMFLLRL